MTLSIEAPQLKPKDFATDQDVRWCPGCGDYAILAAVQRALAKQGLPPHRIATVAGSSHDHAAGGLQFEQLRFVTSQMPLGDGAFDVCVQCVVMHDFS